MITTRRMPLEVELVHWLLLAFAAIALVLATATLLAAADPMMEPRLLPDDMGKIARPMQPGDAPQPFFPEMLPQRDFPPAEAAARLWRILEQHRTGRTADALAGWEELGLPPGKAHWREIGMGAAYLRAGQMELATVHLDAARQMAPDHAIVAYYRGILNLEQAAAEGTVPEKGNDATRLVAFGPGENIRRFQTLAANDLMAAIAQAPTVRLDERLLDVGQTIEENVIVPCVGDLLTALGADNFAGRAHHMLFGLLLDQGRLIEAEVNLDAAAATGIATLHGYRDLADNYLQMDRHGDAMRTLKKELQVNHPEVVRAWEGLEEMTKAAVKGTWVW